MRTKWSVLVLLVLLAGIQEAKAACGKWTMPVKNFTPESFMVRASRLLPDGTCVEHSYPFMHPNENWRTLEARGYWDIDNLYIPQAYPPVAWAYYFDPIGYTYGVRLKRADWATVFVNNSDEVTSQGYRVRRVDCSLGGCEWRNNW